MRDIDMATIAEISLPIEPHPDPKKATYPNWVYKREGTSTGSLLWNTRNKAEKEGKVAMLALGQVRRQGFLIAVHANDWDLARKEWGK